jgi:hypothetical protein
MPKGRKVPPRGFLGDDAVAQHAYDMGLRVNWMQSQIIGGISYMIIDVDLQKRPDIQRLIRAARQSGSLDAKKRYRWQFLTAAVGPDEGRTFIILEFHIDAPHNCDFDIVFVEGDHDAALEEWRACSGRFLLGYQGNAIALQAPLEDLAEGLRNHKIGLGLAGPTTPTA